MQQKLGHLVSSFVQGVEFSTSSVGGGFRFTSCGVSLAAGVTIVEILETMNEQCLQDRSALSARMKGRSLSSIRHQVHCNHRGREPLQGKEDTGSTAAAHPERIRCVIKTIAQHDV